MKGNYFFELLFASSLVLAACSAKIEGAAKENSIPANVTEHQVQGPILDGSWKSDCHYKVTSGRYEIVSMIIAGQYVNRQIDYYSDSLCKNSVRSEAWHGLFRFMKKLGDDAYEVEYQLDLGSGVTQLTGENVKLTKTLSAPVLWISEYYVGENQEPSLALKKY